MQFTVTDYKYASLITGLCENEEIISIKKSIKMNIPSEKVAAQCASSRGVKRGSLSTYISR